MIISIDIGTSYSSICMLGADGKAVPVDISTGASMYGSKYSLPSAVFVEDDGNVLVGQAAMNSRKKKPQNFRMEFKRDLGQDIPIVLGNESFLPEDFYTELFRHMKACVAKVSDEPIEKACLTCPAAFGKKKREKVLQAAKAAGLFCAKLVDEPTAAAMSFEGDGILKGNKTLMIYDFGGGTFDVSLLSYDSGKFSLLTEPSGLEQCGGIDIDRLIFADMQSCIDPELMKKISADPKKSMRLSVQLSELAVKAKHHLSTAQTFEEYIEVGMEDFEYALTVDRLNTMIAGLIGQTIDTCRKIVADAGLKVEDLSAVLMVGGTSRVPLVQSMVKQFAGKVPVHCSLDLDLAVAKGALEFGRTGNTGNSGNAVEAAVQKNIRYTENSVVEKNSTYAQSTGNAWKNSDKAGSGQNRNGGSQTLEEQRQQYFKTAMQYYTGSGLPKNYEKAVEYFAKAAENGHREAAVYMGKCWEMGSGVKADPAIAKRWYEKAAKLGASSAEFQNAKKVSQSASGSQNITKASRPASSGYKVQEDPARSDYEAGLLNEGKKNFVTAVLLYKIAAEKGNMAALTRLGLCYKNGLGVTKDDVEAAQLFLKAARSGEAEAMLYLGECHENGQGMVRDNVQARMWYEKAARAGRMEEAQEALKRLEEKVQKEKVQKEKVQNVKVQNVKVSPQQPVSARRKPEIPELVERFIEQHPKVEKGKGAFSEGSLSQLRSCLKVPLNENVLLAHDDTFRRSGKNGFIMTERGIYTRKLWSEVSFIDWKNFIGSKIYQDTTCIICNGIPVGYYTPTQDMKDFWPALQAYLKENTK